MQIAHVPCVCVRVYVCIICTHNQKLGAVFLRVFFAVALAIERTRYFSSARNEFLFALRRWEIRFESLNIFCNFFLFVCFQMRKENVGENNTKSVINTIAYQKPTSINATHGDEADLVRAGANTRLINNNLGCSFSRAVYTNYRLFSGLYYPLETYCFSGNLLSGRGALEWPQLLPLRMSHSRNNRLAHTHINTQLVHTWCAHSAIGSASVELFGSAPCGKCVLGPQ